MDIKYYNSQEVREKLSMKTCIELMRQVFLGLSKGEVTNQLRSVLPIESGKLMGVMPALLPYEEVVGAKLITVFHDNFKAKLPSHQGVVALFSTTDGQLMGICDGMAITAVRTGAVSAVATDCLANKSAQVLCLMGAGVQAGTHLEAISLVRELKKVNVWSIYQEEAKNFIEKYSKSYPQIDFTAFENPGEAVRDADIICTVTASHTPVLKGEWLKPGVHINAVGACSAKDRELDGQAMAKGKLVCDSRVSCLNEAGDYLLAKSEGMIVVEDILAEIGDVLSGKSHIRQSEDDITIFEALGLAAEDIACAAWLLKQ
ncbi:MAG: ornithine cyclodeaminase family protein [Oscillospiraceae bacterium]